MCGGGEMSGAQPVVRGNQNDHHVSVIATGTVDDHKDSHDIHDGNIDSGCLDGGALKTSKIELEVNHSPDKVVEVAKKDSCEQDEEDLGGFSNDCSNNKTLSSNSCEIEEDVNRSTADFDGNDTNKNDHEKNAKSCGSSSVSGKLNTACQLTAVVTDILGKQNNGATSTNIVEEIGERHEVVPGLGDNTETRPESDENGEDNGNKMKVCRTEKEPQECNRKNVAVNCVGSHHSQTATKLKNNGAGRRENQDCAGVVSNDSGFNDTDGEHVNHVQQVTDNGNSHVRERNGIEEDNGLNPKNSSSIDMAKEMKASESCGCEGSDDPDSINQDNVPRSTSNSDEDFQRSVERATTVVTIMNGTCQDGHVNIDHSRPSLPAMKDVSIQVFDENWIWASSSSSDTSQTMSGCSSNGDRGGDKGPGSREDPSTVQRILSSIVHLFSCCV